MTKQYFTKYLPVEGEIKEGDLCTCPHKGKGIDVGKGQPKQVQVLFTYTKDRNLCKDCTKVKLFLCSRDIVVGDKIWSSHHNIFLGTCKDDYGELIKFEEGGDYIKDSSLFKVIGEISPEATWVKEGMEFDKEQVKTYIFGLHYGIMNHPFDMDDDKTTWCKIKCPNCEHFH